MCLNRVWKGEKTKIVRIVNQLKQKKYDRITLIVPFVRLRVITCRESGHWAFRPLRLLSLICLWRCTVCPAHTKTIVSISSRFCPRSGNCNPSSVLFSLDIVAWIPVAVLSNYSQLLGDRYNCHNSIKTQVEFVAWSCWELTHMTGSRKYLWSSSVSIALWNCSTDFDGSSSVRLPKCHRKWIKACQPSPCLPSCWPCYASKSSFACLSVSEYIPYRQPRANLNAHPGHSRSAQWWTETLVCMSSRTKLWD